MESFHQCQGKTIESGSVAGRLALEVARFEPLPGNRTRFTGSTYMQSAADRDEWLRLGVEKGTRDAHGHLERLLEMLVEEGRADWTCRKFKASPG